MMPATSLPPMPRPIDKPTDKPAEVVPDKLAEKPLTRHLVIIAGVDHIVMAADEADLQKQIEQLRKQA
jgi:hypothetical protein